MTSQHHSGLPPSILVSSHDLARLEALLDSPAFNKHPAATALSDELGRARVVPPDQIPGDVVTMHSRIDCEDELHGERHTLTLAYIRTKPMCSTAASRCWRRSAVRCLACRSVRASTGARPTGATCVCVSAPCTINMPWPAPDFPRQARYRSALRPIHDPFHDSREPA